MTNEIWKDVPEFEGLYMISNFGRIKSLMYKKIHREKILKNELTIHGYFLISLSKNKKRYKKSVHRLVAITFLGYSDLFVNHKNGIKTDNRVENLEWVTHSENCIHAYKIGLCDKHIQKIREKNLKRLSKDHPSSILTEEKVIEIRNLVKKGHKQSDLARLYEVSRTTINDIVKFRSWTKMSLDKLQK